jgi:hypothetical protein
MRAARLAFAVVLAAGAAPLAACDLDGLPGFHRANPFARAPIFRGTPAPLPPGTPGTPVTGQPDDKPRGAVQPAPAAQPRSWERTDNPEPISAEDKAVFT